MTGAITFNTNDLQTYSHAAGVGIITNRIDHTDIPEQEATLYSIADANGSTIPSINYPSKRIIIGGAIKGSSQSDLDDRIDTFKSYFNGKDKNLDIAYGSSTRRYIATKNSVAITREQKALYAIFTVEFICTQPFGVETTPTSIANEIGNTATTFNMTPTIGGTAPSQLPIFTITINALTGDGDYIQISNDNNNQAILVFGLGLEAGDVVVIDCAEREVRVNGNLVDYSGIFLELEIGANSLTYADGFTTRDVDIEAEYTKRYL